MFTDKERIAKLESLLADAIGIMSQRPIRIWSEFVEDLITLGIPIPEKWEIDLKHLKAHGSRFADKLENEKC